MLNPSSAFRFYFDRFYIFSIFIVLPYCERFFSDDVLSGLGLIFCGLNTVPFIAIVTTEVKISRLIGVICMVLLSLSIMFFISFDFFRLLLCSNFIVLVLYVSSSKLIIQDSSSLAFLSFASFAILQNNDGYFHNNGLSFIYLALLLPNVVYFYFNSHNVFKVVCFFLFVYLLTINESRLFVLSCLISVFYVFLIVYREHEHFKRLFVSSIIIVFVLFSFIITNLKFSSTLGRFEIYKISLDMITDHPFSGIGFDSFKLHYNLYQANAVLNKSVMNDQLLNNTFFAINEYLQLIVELGIVGLILVGIYFCFVLRILKRLPAQVDNEDFVYKLFFAILSVLFLFSYCLHSLPLILLILTLISLSRQENAVFFLKISKKYLWFIISFFLILFVFHVFLYFQLINLQNSRSKSVKVDGYSTLYPFVFHNPVFLYNYGVQQWEKGEEEKALKTFLECTTMLSHADLYIYIGLCYQKSKLYSEAEKYLNIARYMVPHKLYAKYCLMNLYIEKNECDKLIDIAKIIVEQDLKVYSMLGMQIKDSAEFVLSNNKCLVQTYGK